MTSTFDEQMGQALGVAAPTELIAGQEHGGTEAGDVPGRRLTRLAKELRSHPTFMLASGFLIVLAAAAIFAPVISRYSPNAQDILHTFATPSSQHWLGTDDLGRDNYSRIVYGARASLEVVFFVELLSLAIAVPVGTFSGFRSGKLDLVVMRVTDVFSCIPPLVLAIVLATVIGVNSILPEIFIPGVARIVIALAVIQTPVFIRVIRGQTLAVSAETYVEASRSVGIKDPTLIRRHITPNILSTLIVQITVSAGALLLAEASLSYIGVGVALPNPSWGSMLQDFSQYALDHGWLMWIPGGAIALTVLSFFVVGEGLQEVLGRETTADKRTKRGRLGVTAASVREVSGPESAEPAPPNDVCIVQSGASRETGLVAAATALSHGSPSVLQISGLRVEFDTPRGITRVVDDISLEVSSGEVLGLVGESGSGKSVTVSSIMRLLPTPPAHISGSIKFYGEELLAASRKRMQAIRGNDIAMVFQDQMSALNPAYTIGNQLVEAIRLHKQMPRAKAEQRATDLLALTAIPDPKRRMKAYPHELSGGMRQRVLIAMALSCEPKLLIADEPTTALDVTTQAQILELLKSLQDDFGLAMIFVTHDLGVVADLCDRVAVMYAGQIVEMALVDDLFLSPRHPYTQGLLASIPRPGTKLVSIPGQVPAPNRMPAGCRFQARCAYATDKCTSANIELVDGVEHTRSVRCARSMELQLEGVK